VRQQFQAKVVGQEQIVSGERQPAIALRSPCPHGQRGKVQPDRPPLRPPDELRRLRVAKLDPSALQQSASILVVHGQLVDPDLYDLALGAQRCHWERQLASGSQGKLRPSGKPDGKLGDRVQALPVAEYLHVVENQGHGLAHGGQRGRQPRHDGGRDGGARRGQSVEHPRVDELDTVKRGGDVGQQDRRIVVAVVDRNPAHPAPLALGPLGQQRGLAVAGGSDDADDWRGMRPK
jgi:hypothetical protein